MLPATRFVIFVYFAAFVAAQRVLLAPTQQSVPPRKKPGDDQCPPCFNCMLPMFQCKQFSTCNEFTGQCDCIEGFGGIDCAQPVCGALSDGKDRPQRPENVTSCDCKPGWGGINCNICKQDDVCDAFMPKGLKGTCYKQGLIINKLHQMCDVTNPKIVEILNGREPQVTFACNKTAENCNFQFWIAQKESFYCDLNKCHLEYDLKANTSHYRCEDVQCKCIPGRMLCGEKGSIDISDFLTETIAGPGDFACDVSKSDCSFSEPSMNDLIMNVFGDPHITLHCSSGECIHYSEIPGYLLPPKKSLSLYNLLFIFAVVVGVGCFATVVWLYVRKSPMFEDFDDSSSSGSTSDENNDLSNSTLISSHTPCTLTFENIGYTIKGRNVLNNAFGIVRPREMLAIMGGSGAGKTTLLDILAGKNKDGQIYGDIKINGKKLTYREFKKIIGFVDQEDYLIPTLTVYETVLNSALLRLPRSMPIHAKKVRVLEVLEELRILKIKDRLIGSDLERGISGGEKRRVAIACELVTSPSILFLDEPTSGLDSYNAKKVVECLVRLSRDYERTIIFTIHQPRSNIVALFDKLLLLSEGQVVYSGDMMKCNEFFTDQGFVCPTGYNIADYLIDVTSDSKGNSAAAYKDDEHDHNHDIEQLLTRADTIDATDEWAHYASHRDELAHTLVPSATSVPAAISSQAAKLTSVFLNSVFAEEIKEEIKQSNANSAAAGVGLINYKKASVLQQIAILSSRTFKNIYRNPKLLLTQYLLSVFMGCFLSVLYYDIQNDIGGFQNRLGFFFFVLSFFGFSTLTGLHAFSIERIVYMRERSNDYYHSFSYYFSKILCDVLPLRVFPPVILLAITYPLVGLNMDNQGFLKTCAILILFNLATSLEVLIIGIVVKESGNATLIGVLVLLFSMLFSGLFVNMKNVADTSSAGTVMAKTFAVSKPFIDLNILKYLSTFHYGYESLLINEVRTLVLRETKYGLKIEVPGATILSTFGFNVGNLWPDITMLACWVAIFLALGFACLHYFVIEKR